MDVIKTIIDDTISSLQLPNGNNVSDYIPVVMESITIHLLKRGYQHVASARIKEPCSNRLYTTSKMVLLVDNGSHIYYIITFHVKARTIWKIACKRSHYNEVMNITYDNGSCSRRYEYDNEINNTLKIQLNR